MKKLFSIVLVSLLVVGLIGCSAQAEGSYPIAEAQKSDKRLIVATNSILADLVEQVVGDDATVYSIVPIGTDPHEYEPLPEDIQAVTDADVVFYNGLNLETGGNSWFANLMETTKKVEHQDYFVVSESVEPMYLTSKGQEQEQDPHAWLDIQNAIKYVENIAEIMQETDSVNKKNYEERAKAYITRLEHLDAEAKEKFSDLPPENKLLVSSEGAFKYFSAAYDLTAAYIWEINTESQGTPEQMTRIIDTIRQSNVPVLFVETSVDPRTMEQVSSETGVPIYETIFTDSLAKEGAVGDNYYDMMSWNLTKIYEGLSG